MNLGLQERGTTKSSTAFMQGHGGRPKRETPQREPNIEQQTNPDPRANPTAPLAATDLRNLHLVVVIDRQVLQCATPLVLDLDGHGMTTQCLQDHTDAEESWQCSRDCQGSLPNSRGRRSLIVASSAFLRGEGKRREHEEDF